uniref:4Fe-4S ferredoxin-type domain-containing protein n=1 Tax=Fagus sylvatica TaxID=28930 RepID=A0A2N9HIL1_FAGSY
MEEVKSDAAIDAIAKKDGNSEGLGVGHGATGMEAVEDHDCHGCGLCLQEAGKDLVWF